MKTQTSTLLGLALALALLPVLVTGGTLRSTPSGFLTFIEAQFDEIGLGAAHSVALSPDDNHVYVACFDEDAIVVFSRDEVTGALTFVEKMIDDVGGVDGLDGAISVALSPDGNHVYAASYLDDAVAVFSRDGVTGALTFVEMQQDGVDSVDGLYGASSVALSPDGSYVYVTGQSDNAVAVFSRDEATGALTFVEMERDGVGGVDGLYGARSVAVSPDGNHVYVASLHDDAVAVFSRDAGTGALTFVEMQRDGVGSVDGLDGAISVALSPDGEHVYVAGYLDNAVAVFSRDGVTGALTFVEMQQDGVDSVDGLCQAWSVSVSPDGSHVYVAGQNDNAVAVFSRDGATGALTFVEMQQDGVGGVDGLDGAVAVAVSFGGSHVYVAGYSDDAVAVFSRDEATGALTFVEKEGGVGVLDGLDGAISVALSPDGGHVYVAGQNDNAVAVFSRDGDTGTLTFVEMQRDGVGGVDGLDNAVAVAVSPDGSHVYVAGYSDDAVAVFSRDAGTGALIFVEIQQDGIGGVDGLDGASAVALSPDGSHVYVTSWWDDAVAVFGRDADTGALTFVEMQRDGVGGVDGLDGARSVALDPDGDYVYVAGSDDHAVAVFSRDRATGALTYVEMQQDGVGGVDGLSSARSVAVSPNGDDLYVAGCWDDAVAVFSRNASDGKLTYVEMQQDGVGGVDGLDGAWSVAISPNGHHVYVAGFEDDAVVVFGRQFVIYLPLVAKSQ